MQKQNCKLNKTIERERKSDGSTLLDHAPLNTFSVKWKRKKNRKNILKKEK